MGRVIFAASLVGLALGGGVSAAAPAAPTAQLMQSCDAHKFETLVDAMVDGQPHQSKVKLCGKEGQSDADWILTLQDAIAKLNANKNMAPEVRTQIVTAINAEITRLQSAAPAEAKPQTETATALPPPRPQPRVQDSLSDDYAALPPLPTAPPPPPHVLGPGGTLLAATSSTKHERSDRVQAPLPLAAGPAPKLNFTCYSPGDVGDDAPCAEFDRETRLTLRAGENIPAGASLLFLRNGEQRASVDLAQLQRGKAFSLLLPSEVCQGVSDGSLELQLVRNGTLLKKDGPYSLRC